MAKGSFKMKGGCMTVNTVLIVVVIVLGVLLAYTYLHKQQPSTQPSKMMEHFESTPADLNPQEGEVIVALFSADWCPHCKEYKPTWKKLASKNDNNSVNGKKIRFVDADCSTTAHPASSKYNVEGYPTLVAISSKKHKTIERVTTMDELTTAISDM